MAAAVAAHSLVQASRNHPSPAELLRSSVGLGAHSSVVVVVHRREDEANSRLAVHSLALVHTCALGRKECYDEGLVRGVVALAPLALWGLSPGSRSAARAPAWEASQPRTGVAGQGEVVLLLGCAHEGRRQPVGCHSPLAALLAPGLAPESVQVLLGALPRLGLALERWRASALAVPASVDKVLEGWHSHQPCHVLGPIPLWLWPRAQQHCAEVKVSPPTLPGRSTRAWLMRVMALSLQALAELRLACLAAEAWVQDPPVLEPSVVVEPQWLPSSRCPRPAELAAAEEEQQWGQACLHQAAPAVVGAAQASWTRIFTDT